MSEKPPAGPASKSVSPDRRQVDHRGLLAYSYLNGTGSLEKALERFGGPQGLLRSASQSLAASVSYDPGESSPQSSDDEIRELARFAREAGLMMRADEVRTFFRENAMIGGAEHKVAEVIEVGRVLKDLDAHAIATQSLFDYFTDHELANFLLGDSIEIEGFYEYEGRLHILISQPWIDGLHPDLPVLKKGLEEKGLESESPSGSTGIFTIPTENLGNVHLIDIKPNNVILDEMTGEIIPIDIHFYFDTHEDRLRALEELGLRDTPMK